MDCATRHCIQFNLMYDRVLKALKPFSTKKLTQFLRVLYYLSIYNSPILHAGVTNKYVEYILGVDTFIYVRVPFNLPGKTVEVIFQDSKTGKNSKKKRMNVMKLVRLLNHVNNSKNSIK